MERLDYNLGSIALHRQVIFTSPADMSQGSHEEINIHPAVLTVSQQMAKVLVLYLDFSALQFQNSSTLVLAVPGRDCREFDCFPLTCQHFEGSVNDYGCLQD